MPEKKLTNKEIQERIAKRREADSKALLEQLGYGKKPKSKSTSKK